MSALCRLCGDPVHLGDSIMHMPMIKVSHGYDIDALQIRLTDTHILYMSATPKQSFSSRAALPAAKVRVGQYVWVTATTFDAAAASAAAEPSRIVNVRRVMDVGLVNPFTLHGESSAATASLAA